MLITENKLVYPEFKTFKSIYTSINFTEKITFLGNTGYFSRDNQFFFIYGKFTVDSGFFKWLEGRIVEVRLEDLVTIGKTLKKNAISIESNDQDFIFNFLDSDGNNQQIVFSANAKLPDWKEKIDLINQKLIHEQTIPSEWLEEDVLEIFIKDNEISNTKVDGCSKLLEVPVKKLDIILKNSENKLLYSDIENENRFICINSKNIELGLELNQVCLCLV